MPHNIVFYVRGNAKVLFLLLNGTQHAGQNKAYAATPGQEVRNGVGLHPTIEVKQRAMLTFYSNKHGLFFGSCKLHYVQKTFFLLV